MSTKIFVHHKAKKLPSEDPVYQAELKRLAIEQEERKIMAGLVREERRRKARMALEKREAPPAASFPRLRKMVSEMTDEEMIGILDLIIAADSKARIVCRKIVDRHGKVEVAQVARVTTRIAKEFAVQLRRLGYQGADIADKEFLDRSMALITEGINIVIGGIYETDPTRTLPNTHAAYMASSTTTTERE